MRPCCIREQAKKPISIRRCKQRKIGICQALRSIKAYEIHATKRLKNLFHGSAELAVAISPRRQRLGSIGESDPKVDLKNATEPP